MANLYHKCCEDEQLDEPCKTYDAGKTRYELIPYDVLDGLAKVLEIGAEKYEVDNWRKGMRWSRHFGCLLRHLFAWYYHRKDTDDESGQNHLDHALARIIFLRYYQKHGIGTDDRPKKSVDIDCQQ